MMCVVAYKYGMIARWYGTYVDVLVRDNTPPRDSGNPPSDITSSHFFCRRASSNLCVIIIIIWIISILIVQCHIPSYYRYDKIPPGENIKSGNFITIIILIIIIGCASVLSLSVPHPFVLCQDSALPLYWLNFFKFLPVASNLLPC